MHNRERLNRVFEPIRDILPEVAYNKFLNRWSEKLTTEAELAMVEYLFAAYARLFTKTSMESARAETGHIYQLLSKARVSSVRTEFETADKRLNRLLAHGLTANPWMVATHYVFSDRVPELNPISESRKMAFRLFLGILSSMSKQSAQGASEDGKVSTRGSASFEHGTLTTIMPSDEELGIWELSLEEQIEKFNLHPESYF